MGKVLFFLFEIAVLVLLGFIGSELHLLSCALRKAPTGDASDVVCATAGYDTYLPKQASTEAQVADAPAAETPEPATEPAPATEEPTPAVTPAPAVEEPSEPTAEPTPITPSPELPEPPAVEPMPDAAAAPDEEAA